MTTTQQPTNASEWQLYRVLQRANLLQYYDTFVAQGGDDVQQLCEAGEEEFLEIMALVGMASKPLHVRRLQKALQEWVANPAAFQGNGTSAILKREPPTQVLSLPPGGPTPGRTDSPSPGPGPGPWVVQQRATPPPLPPPQKSTSPLSMVASNRPLDLQPELSAATPQQMKKSSSPQPGACSSSTTPGGQPVLHETQVAEIARCAAKLAAQMPYFEVKPLNMKKEVNKQILDLISVDKDHPERLELMRKYGAIYRRFDSQRSYGKPMSMHEICVNEASAQLCYHMPSLLTRREDLFPLARQVVKDSGYQYSKGHSRSAREIQNEMLALSPHGSTADQQSKAGDLNATNPSKRQKLDFLAGVPGFEGSNLDRAEREERLKAISAELSEIATQQEQIVGELDGVKDGQDQDCGERQEALQSQLETITNRHLQLLTEQSELLRKQSYEVYDVDGLSDRDDSSLGPSGSNSPAQVDRTSDTSQHAALRAALASGLLPANLINNTSAGMKNTLFDEGIRIAQQYGMCDFANELKTLQVGEDEEEGQGHPEGQSHPEGQGQKVSNPERKGVKRENENGASEEVDSKKIKNLSSGQNPVPNSTESSDENSNLENGLEQEVTSQSPLELEVETQNGV